MPASPPPHPALNHGPTERTHRRPHPRPSDAKAPSAKRPARPRRPGARRTQRSNSPLAGRTHHFSPLVFDSVARQPPFAKRSHAVPHLDHASRMFPLLGRQPRSAVAKRTQPGIIDQPTAGIRRTSRDGTAETNPLRPRIAPARRRARAQLANAPETRSLFWSLPSRVLPGFSLDIAGASAPEEPQGDGHSKISTNSATVLLGLRASTSNDTTRRPVSKRPSASIRLPLFSRHER